MRILPFVPIALLAGCASSAGLVPRPMPLSLTEALQRRLRAEPGTVSLVFRDLGTGGTAFLDPDRRFHAASTMKVPVLIQLARDVDSGRTRWDDSIPVRNSFRSIVDGSPFTLDRTDDSDSSLYALEGRRLSQRRLAELMIERSSNLATNLLIARLDAKRVNATAHALGADSIEVRRGVEDGKAYEKGLNNTTTARDLATLLTAIATDRAASPGASREILRMLLAQELNEGIPAGLPPGTRVAHKTGSITALLHDAAIVYPPGRRPYVLVVLTRGYPNEADAARVIADLSRIVYQRVTAPGAAGG
jgi:beta-lactamase class A